MIYNPNRQSMTTGQFGPPKYIQSWLRKKNRRVYKLRYTMSISNSYWKTETYTCNSAVVVEEEEKESI